MSDLHEKFEIALAHKEKEAEEKDAEIAASNQEIQTLADQVYRLEDENERLKEESERLREEDAVELERLEALATALKEVRQKSTTVCCLTYTHWTAESCYSQKPARRAH
jgi:uncharacterized protein (DUF3084 family)